MRSWFPRSAVISAGIFCVLVLVLVGVVLSVHHQDNRRSAQFVTRLPAPPTAHEMHGGCGTRAWHPKVTNGRGGLVTADAQPTGAVIYWLPGSTATKCHVAVTKLTASRASVVATDVRESSSRSGDFSCALDDGSSAWIFFRYADRAGLEVVHAGLSGCSVADAPGRGGVGPYWQGTDLLQALRPVGTTVGNES